MEGDSVELCVLLEPSTLSLDRQLDFQVTVITGTDVIPGTAGGMYSITTGIPDIVKIFGTSYYSMLISEISKSIIILYPDNRAYMYVASHLE